MTPLLTVNLLRALFVTFCATIGGIVSAEVRENAIPGIVVGVIFGLFVMLVDRLLKAISVRASRRRPWAVAWLLFANLLVASDVLRFQTETNQWTARLARLLHVCLSRDARDAARGAASRCKRQGDRVHRAPDGSRAVDLAS